ncbi:uncharacterized protein LOC123879742 isoform X3 [Maniola jurtina]|uniref:uncharacterized protein LOC123879742 isoform X3 n=1 Tax=Maniola jurtina TaxID=191418 RepID=UPI001E688A36|nr:uncharacterized protein LOC123879742 isoform X3 [Maniola jurtina]
MASCAVNWCRKSSKTYNYKNDGITFHRFPRNSEYKEKWINATCRGEKWFPNKYSIICSRHFTEDCFQNMKNRRKLKKTALPTLNLPILINLPRTPLSPKEGKDKPKVTEIASPERVNQPIVIPAATDASRAATDEADSDSDGLIDDPSDLSDFLVFNQTESAGATQQPSTEELQSSTTPIQPSTSTFGEIKYQTSTSTAEGVQYQPTTSRHEQLPYQPSKYSMACENKKIALEEVILIKEEITEEEKNQCRLCLSVGRRMQELGEYALLYRKLLFENNFQNTTIPSFMYQILACWECHAELRRIDRFQDKVRRANNAFETNQNRNCESLSNLSAILIGEYKKSEAEEAEDAEEAEEEQESEKLSRVEECAQEIKEEAVEVEVEETSLPDPLEFNQEDRKAGWRAEIVNLHQQKVAISEIARRLKTSRNTVRLWIRRFAISGRLEARRSGPLAKAYKDDSHRHRAIVDTYSNDPYASTRTIATKLNITLQTVRNHLKAAGLRRCRHPKEDKLLSSAHKRDEENLDIRNEPNISAPTQKAVKRTPPEPKMPQNVPKRPKLGQTLTSGPRRPKLDGSGPKTAQEEENNLKFTEETSPEAIFAKVQIEINELVKILDERRSIESFRNMRFKCDSCILGFTNHNRLLEHNRNFHNQEFGSCECAICERRFGDERRLSAHYRNHFVKFVCKLCNYECYTKTGQAIHFKRHKSATQAASSLLRPIKTYQRASASESSCESST